MHRGSSLPKQVTSKSEQNTAEVEYCYDQGEILHVINIILFKKLRIYTVQRYMEYLTVLIIFILYKYVYKYLFSCFFFRAKMVLMTSDAMSNKEATFAKNWLLFYKKGKSFYII